MVANDGDSTVDFRTDGGGDLGCAAADDPSELGTPACDDGDDNDGDGYIDCQDDDCVETAAVTVCDATDEGGSTDGGEEGGGDNSCVGYCGSGAPSCYCDASCVM